MTDVFNLMAMAGGGAALAWAMVRLAPDQQKSSPMSDPVIAPIGYVAPMTVMPVSAPVPARNKMKYDRREMPIRDGHAIPGGARLETHGFACLKHSMSPVDLDDGSEWKERFTGEATAFIRAMTGASDVVTRSVAPRSTRYRDSSGTIDFAHNDYTGASIGTFIAEIDPERAEERLAKRFAVYNLWRLLSPPPQNRPLAVCDATSLAGADVIPSQTYTYGEHYYQNALFRYNPAHRWYYYPNMQTDEMLVWAAYDSDPHFPSLVPHVAFEDPNCTDPAAYRSNIDARVFVFYDD